MIVYADESVADLAAIEKTDGRAAMLMLFRCCEELAEPAIRLQAVRLGGDTFRLRVGNFNIVFELEESSSGDQVKILRVRPRR